jgi:hypothetical protein
MVYVNVPGVRMKTIMILIMLTVLSTLAYADVCIGEDEVMYDLETGTEIDPEDNPEEYYQLESVKQELEPSNAWSSNNSFQNIKSQHMLYLIIIIIGTVIFHFMNRRR